MMSYRFKRRSFLAGVGGAVGLKTMLRNMEASAQGMPSPGRLLLTHWPVGIVAFAWNPGGTGSTYTTSESLKPYEDRGLRPDMTILKGIQIGSLASNGGGSHEGGTVKLMTGIGCPGTRGGLPEGDDGYAGGPSFDQIMLKNVPSLKVGRGYVNSICDARVDFLETSTQCLSYDYLTNSVARSPSGTGTENIPLLPTLSPLTQYNALFSGFMPGGSGGASGTGGRVGGTGGASGTGGRPGGTGGAGGGAQNAMLRALRCRKSVLDYSINELAALKSLAPAGEANKIDIHTQAIRAVETQLSNAINMMGGSGGMMGGTGGGSGTGGRSGSGGSSGSGGAGGAGIPTKCTAPGMPAANQTGKTGSRNDYNATTTSTEDAPIHAMVAQLHMDILRTAFICDLIRVATFQFSPGTNHVSFKLFPASASSASTSFSNTIYMHHPESHKIGTGQTTSPGNLSAHFLANVNTWYNTQMATFMQQWKGATDGMGGNLLDHTVVPFVTEVQATGHEQNGMPAMIFGGKALGFQHGTYTNVNNRIINDFWLTIAQPWITRAQLMGADGMTSAFAAGGTGPIANLWRAP